MDGCIGGPIHSGGESAGARPACPWKHSIIAEGRLHPHAHVLPAIRFEAKGGVHPRLGAHQVCSPAGRIRFARRQTADCAREKGETRRRARNTTTARPSARTPRWRGSVQFRMGRGENHAAFDASFCGCRPQHLGFKQGDPRGPLVTQPVWLYRTLGGKRKGCAPLAPVKSSRWPRGQERAG